MMTNGSFRMQITGLAGAGGVLVFAATNIVDGVSVFTDPPYVGTLEFLDAGMSNFPARFYQAAEAPKSIVTGLAGLFVALSSVCRARYASWFPTWRKPGLCSFPAERVPIASFGTRNIRALC